MKSIFALVVLLVSFVVSYLAIRRYLRFALDKQILDIPNERSSHAVPTPRGAGVAFAAVFLVFVILLGFMHVLLLQDLLAIVAGALVAAVGYWDDRCSLNIRTRLAVQLCAASIVVASLATFHVPGRASSSVFVMAVLMCMEILGITWILNLTNFMDGIDGIVGIEVVTVTAVCAGLIVAERGITVSALLFAMLGVTVAPFLFYNWSPAKVFMGDVGSCFIGFTLGVLSLIAAAHHQLSLLCPLILLGVFISDATCTLVTRMLTGQRWYAPHRTHAFQILARRYGHRRVAGSVGIVNLVWLAPLAIAAEYDQARGIVYAVVAFAPLLIVCRVLGVGNPKMALEPARPFFQAGTVTAWNPNGIPNWLGGNVESLMHRFFPPFQLAFMAILSLTCIYAALRVHFDGPLSSNTRALLLQIAILWSACQCLVLACLRLHKRHWRFASVEEFPTLAGITLLGSTAGAICAALFSRMHGVVLPRPVYLLESALSILAFAGLRVFFRQTYDVGSRLLRRSERKPVLICSADVAGISMLSELRLYYPEYRPVGFIDERPEVRGISICGLRVLGKREDLKMLLKKYSIHHVFISQRMQSDSAVEAIRNDCLAENVDLHIVSPFVMTSSLSTSLSTV
jgi:Fuc2NAc and GlcNAc transferase